MIVYFLYYKKSFDAGVIALVLTSGLSLDNTFKYAISSLG